MNHWKDEFDKKYLAGELEIDCDGGGIPFRKLHDFIESTLQQHDEELIRELEGIKKGVKELFSNIPVEATEEFAIVCEKKNMYNLGIMDSIDLIKSRQRELSQSREVI